MIAPRTSKKVPLVLFANSSRANRRSSLSASRRILRKTLQHKRPRQPLAVKNFTDDSLQQQSPVLTLTPSPATASRLPATLPRPQVGEVKRQPIVSAFPELEKVPTEYIRKKLVSHGAEMLTAVASVRTQPPSSSLPRELEIVVNDMVAAACPTHMLAIYAPSSSTQKRKVTLFPTHHLVLAAHCTNLPSFPHSKPESTELKSTVHLPVVPICLPSPETFSILQSFLYTKRMDILFASLLPPSSLSEPPTSVSGMVNSLSYHLALTGNIPSLTRHSMIINGLWKNACAFGIQDEKLWEAIEVCWEIVVRAMNQLRRKH